MSAGKNSHYLMAEVMGRHFVQTGKLASLGVQLMRDAITELLDRAPTASDQARAAMPDDFGANIHENVAAAIARRLPALASALDEL
jgi:serine/threonine-protein kinase HipA